MHADVICCALVLVIFIPFYEISHSQTFEWEKKKTTRSREANTNPKGKKSAMKNEATKRKRFEINQNPKHNNSNSNIPNSSSEFTQITSCWIWAMLYGFKQTILIINVLESLLFCSTVHSINWFLCILCSFFKPNKLKAAQATGGKKNTLHLACCVCVFFLSLFCLKFEWELTFGWALSYATVCIFCHYLY